MDRYRSISYCTTAMEYSWHMVHKCWYHNMYVCLKMLASWIYLHTWLFELVKGWLTSRPVDADEPNGRSRRIPFSHWGFYSKLPSWSILLIVVRCSLLLVLSWCIIIINSYHMGLFPTCQVRVVRNYVRCAAPPSFFLLPSSSSFFLAGSHLPALDRSEPRQISSASSW